jgi:predicted TIM-barrel fold metal-dependent hydrolase
MSDDRDLPIIDVHHHFWDLSMKAHPWLVEEPRIPFRYGDYSAICRDYLPADYRRDSAAHNVVATVTMEGEWDEADPVAESRWMSAIAAANPSFPAAHVARAILHRADAEDVIAAHAAFPLVRGIRHKPVAAPLPDRITRGVAGSMSDPAWRRGYAALARHGLHFELQAPWWHVDQLLDLIAAHPGVPVVINHAFLPADRSADGLAGWRAALRRAASAPLVAIKISGIGINGKAWSLADNRPIIREIIEVFGPERAMFASNFPVDGLTGTFETIYAGFKAATADLDPAARRALFSDAARRIYRLHAA